MARPNLPTCGTSWFMGGTFCARKAFRLWRQDPSHPSLHFKRVHSREPVYSVRVSLGWRVLGLHEGDAMDWFWIGSHAMIYAEDA